MAAFLIAFVLIGLLIACCVGISIYLFTSGVLGRRNREQMAVATTADDDSDD